MHSLECYFGVFSNKHENNSLVSAETVHHSCIYIILYVNDILDSKSFPSGIAWDHNN